MQGLRIFIPFLLCIGAIPSGAQECSPRPFDDVPVIELGVIRRSGNSADVMVGRDCAPGGSTCQRTVSLSPGHVLIVSAKEGDYRCVHFVEDRAFRSGWLKEERWEPYKPPSSESRLWAGQWGQISIKDVGERRFDVRGRYSSYWAHGHDYFETGGPAMQAYGVSLQNDEIVISQVGSFRYRGYREATIKPANEEVYVSGCTVTLRKAGPFLVAYGSSQKCDMFTGVHAKLSGDTAPFLRLRRIGSE